MHARRISVSAFFYIIPVFKLHRMHEMQAIATDVRGVCLSVCLSRMHQMTQLGFTVRGNRRRRVQCTPRAVCAGSFGAAFAKCCWPLVLHLRSSSGVLLGCIECIRCSLLLPMIAVFVMSVSLSVKRLISASLGKNGQIDQDAVWGEHSRGARNIELDGGPDSPQKGVT